MNSEKDFSKITYDLIAHLYSFVTGGLFILGGVSEAKMRRKAYNETLPLKGNERILDLCCANGKGTRIISELIPNGMVYGIDLNPAMIAFATKNNSAHNNVRFRIGDCSAIPFDTNSFDIVTATLALHELPTHLLKTVLPEIKRVLKKNGYLFVFDFSIPQNPSLYLQLIYYIMRLFEDESAARFMLVNQEELLAKYGFKKVLRNSYLSDFLPATLYQLK